MTSLNIRNSADDGWITIDADPSYHMFTWFIADNLEVANHPLELENIFDYDLLIVKLKARLGTVPTGSNLIIEPKIEDVGFLTSDYVVVDGNNGVLMSDDDGYATLAQGEVLTLGVTQIGSSTPGADLTFQILAKKI